MNDEQQEFQQALESVRKIRFEKRDRNYEDKITLAETVRFLSQFRETDLLSGKEDNWVKSWLSECQHILHLEFEFNLVMSMRYYRTNRESNPYGAHLPPMAAILTLEALERGDSEIDRDDTRWIKGGHFMQSLANDLNSIFRQEGIGGDHGVEWFLTLNAIEMLTTVGPFDSKSSYTSAKDAFLSLIETHEDVLRDEMYSPPGLHVYAHHLSSQGVIPIEIEEPNTASSDRTRIYATLNKLARGEDVSLSDLPSELPEDKQPLWGIARAWVRAANDEPTGILPCHGKVDLDEVFRRVWGDQDAIQNTAISEENLETVRSMGDKQIQNTLVDLFSSNDYVTSTSKGTLDLEREKAHTGIEISDFDIRIKWGNDTSLPVSLPIKSGREAGGKTVEQLAEKNLHQLLRPLSRFNSSFGVVFPVLIAGHSVNANESMKTFRENLDLPVVPIGKKTFTKILVYNNLI